MFKDDDTVYISGAMTGKPGFNFPEFFSWEAMLRQCYRCKVLNPAKHEPGLSYEQYMEIDLAMVRAASHVMLLKGWDESRGSRLEKEEAEKHGKVIVHELDVMCHLTGMFKEKFDKTEQR